MTYSKQLYHYGVAGQRWGQRKYQNYDGTYTAAGKLRYFGQTSGRPMSGRPTSAGTVSTGKITSHNAQRVMGNGAPSYVNNAPKYRTINGTGYTTRPTTPQPTTNYRVIDGTHGQRMMGGGAPSYVKLPTTVGYNSSGGYQMSAKQKARMDAAGQRYAATQAAIAAEAERKRQAAEAAAATKSSKKGSGSKSKKSEEEKAAEKAAKEAEKERKKAEREAEKAAKKKASESAKSAAKAAKEKAKEEAAKAKEEAAKAKEQEAKEKEEASKKHDPIDDDETLSEREKKMYKGISNILEKTGQSMSTYYKNEGFDAIFARYFPGDIDPDEKKVIKKKFMNYYKLEHGEAAIGEYYAVTYSPSIEHHGIKGQKWGVRRYRNYDGSLTQRGLARYRKTEKNYEYSRDKYKDYKDRYKRGEVTKLDVKNAKYEMREDKKTMNKYYRQLHDDYMADKGKELYRSGKRISTRGQIFGKLASGAATASALLRYMGQGDYSKKAAYVAAGSAAAYGLINAYAELPFGDNARLRKYYAHKSLPDVKEKGTYNPHKQRKKETDRGDNKTVAKAKSDHSDLESNAVNRAKTSSKTSSFSVSSEKLKSWGIESSTVNSLNKKLAKYNSNPSNPQSFVDSLTEDEQVALWAITNFGDRK